MGVWSHRPPLQYLGLFYAAYFLGCGFAQAFVIVPGITVSIWPPGGVFLATLILTERRSWPWWILAGFLAEMTAQAIWFGSPWAAGALIYAGNAAGAMTGALLITRFCGRPLRLETLRDVLAFLVFGAGTAPLVSATIGSATLAAFSIKDQTFAGVWPMFWIGDATGILLIAPLTLVVIQHWRGRDKISPARLMEGGVLAVIFLCVAALSLTGYEGFAYLIMPPLLWAAVRFEFKGVAVALILLALITLVLTVSGYSHFVGDAASQREKQVMLQIFLAVSAFSALIVAALSRQHQQAISALREREAKIRRLVDSDIIGIVQWDLDGTIIDANDAFLRMVQYERKDVENGIRWIDMTPPEWQDVHAREEAEELAATGKMQAREKEYFRKDGSRVPVLIGAACFEGQSRQGVAYILDLTDLKRTESALREREHELSQIVNLVPVHIRRLSAEGEPTFFNKRLVDFCGLDLNDLDAANRSMRAAAIQTLVHPEDADRLMATVQNSINTGESYAMKYRFRRPDGSYSWVDGRGEPVRNQHGEITHWYAISIDIDEEMKAQEELRTSKKQLEQMIDAVPALIWTANPNGTPIYINKRYTDVTGATLEDFTAGGASPAFPRGVIHPDDEEMRARVRTHAFETGTPYFAHYRHIRRDGSYRWTETRAEPLRDENGNIVIWYGVSVDIHDLVTAQESLRARERELSLLVETLPALIYCAAPDGKPIYRSRQLSEYLGFNLEDKDDSGKTRLDSTLDDIIHPDDLAAVKEKYMYSLATGEPYALRHRLRRFDGTYRWVETRTAAMRNAAGEIVQWNGVCFDIDAEMRAQENLRLAQENLARAAQAASLSELSASIAHEINQPLAAIVANSHACQRWLGAEPANIERAKITAERIVRDANSAADVISRIRALFRQSTHIRSSEDINRLIREVCRLMADEVGGKEIRIETRLDPDLPLIALDRVQVQQVFANLIRNGIEAMDASAADARSLHISSTRDGSDAIRVEVCDHGTGFNDTERAFEPFFTTKPNGMGMGLAICRSIVESHGGRLWMTNNDTRGATVAFTLPLTAEEPAAGA
ncbi:hypothetical protein IZ6_12940 [Terrihabitans soli]|uniref:histidine kinase n=1 Tax=Terrihabitans soli TaxID=708113 RepID=A0A6S6QNM7_9HYPH|nr:PAS domain S-box protein [Terrihabitans soli]BCJ90559.1 hypothetical protein IZ6_12940 [Terrihabitans soli]